MMQSDILTGISWFFDNYFVCLHISAFFCDFATRAYLPPSDNVTHGAKHFERQVEGEVGGGVHISLSP
jgi:hypothetical protein